MPRSKEQFQIIREETKTKILNSSLELFAQKGYSNTSISDIAKFAKISKGLAYNYFESKEKLMEEVIKMLFIEISSIFIEVDEIKDPFEKLHKMIDLTFGLIEEKDSVWRLYTKVLLQPETISIVEKISGNFMDDLFKALGKIFRKAKVKNPYLEAKLFGALLDGISFHVLVMGDKYPLSKTKEFFKKKYSRENLI